MLRRCLLLLSLLVVVTTAMADEDCFKYIKFPPSELECNPYLSNLKLQCTVMAPSDSSYEIVWFYQGDKTITSTVTCEHNESVAGVLTSVLEVNPSGGSIVGEYYCQIRLGNGSWLDPSQSAMQSLVSEVLINQGVDPCGADPLSAMSVDEPCALFAENVANDSIVGMDCSTLPVPTTSLPSATTLNTPPSDVVTTTPSLGGTPDSPNTGKSNGLEVWLYVVVAVAAVFAMIIVILAILCVGLCLRKSQTIDLETLKKHEQHSPKKHFTSTGSSLIPNGAYQRDTESQEAYANSTLLTNHSQSITVPRSSDYNVLGERDYEVIDIVEAKPEYHRLQRPALPLDRRFRTTLGSSSMKSAGIQSSSTIAATHAWSTSELMKGNGLLAGSEKGDGKVEVEDASANEVLYSLTPAVVPENFLERNDSGGQLLPDDDICKLKSMSEASETLGNDVHESLYGANALPTQPFYHALEKVPETGTMFPEPGNPTAFPVHEYESVPSALGVYETPVPSKKSSAISIPDMIDTLQSHGTSTAMLADSELIKAPLQDITETLSSLELDSSVATFSGSCTARSNGSSTADFTGTCTAESINSSVVDFTDTSDDTQTSPKSLYDFEDVQEFSVHSSHNHTPATEVSDVEAENDNAETSDFTGPFMFPHMIESRESQTHPRNRQNHYKKLDPSTLEPVLKYTKLKLGKKTLV